MNNTIKKNIQSSLKFVYSENNSLSVIFHENELLIGVVGEFNKNLKELEKITGASIYSRGNSILIKSSSDKNEIVVGSREKLGKKNININKMNLLVDKKKLEKNILVKVRSTGKLLSANINLKGDNSAEVSLKNFEDGKFRN